MKSNMILECMKFSDGEGKLRLFKHVERLEGKISGGGWEQWSVTGNG